MQIISREELKKAIDHKENYVLIDVRQPEELSYGIIPTAHNIPLPELPAALSMDETSFEKKYHFKKPAKQDNIVFYCRSGGRAAQATHFAEHQGYHAKNYAGSILDWSEIDKNVHVY
ncbi:rhodanese-like domain-containing protein [Candidatus Woesearchaeota archaeon]|nr:rhodanese-like domain-containing protein [Candidatus Woesearchaeota archaeon]